MMTDHGTKTTGRSVARDPKERKVKEKGRKASVADLPHLTVADQDSEAKEEGPRGQAVEVLGSQGPRPPDACTMVSLLTSRVTKVQCTRTS